MHTSSGSSSPRETRPDSILIPLSLLRDPAVPVALRVFAALATHGVEGNRGLTVREIATEIGKCEKTARRGIAVLRAEGYVSAWKRGHRIPDLHYLTHPACGEVRSSTCGKRKKESGRAGVERASHVRTSGVRTPLSTPYVHRVTSEKQGVSPKKHPASHSTSSRIDGTPVSALDEDGSPQLRPPALHPALEAVLKVGRLGPELKALVLRPRENAALELAYLTVRYARNVLGKPFEDRDWSQFLDHALSEGLLSNSENSARLRNDISTRLAKFRCSALPELDVAAMDLELFKACFGEEAVTEAGDA